MAVARLTRTVVDIIGTRGSTEARKTIAQELVHLVHTCALHARIRLALVHLHHTVGARKARIAVASIRADEIDTRAVVAVGYRGHAVGSELGAFVHVRGTLWTAKARAAAVAPVGEYGRVGKAHSAIYAW